MSHFWLNYPFLFILVFVSVLVHTPPVPQENKKKSSLWFGWLVFDYCWKYDTINDKFDNNYLFFVFLSFWFNELAPQIITISFFSFSHFSHTLTQSLSNQNWNDTLVKQRKVNLIQNQQKLIIYFFPPIRFFIPTTLIRKNQFVLNLILYLALNFHT